MGVVDQCELMVKAAAGARPPRGPHAARVLHRGAEGSAGMAENLFVDFCSPSGGEFRKEGKC